MSSPFQDQIEAAMAEFQEHQRKLVSARAKLEKSSTTASSKDHLVTVTLGISGAVKAIKFNRTDYVSMAPAELSAVLVETINKAREKAAAKAQDSFSALTGYGENLRTALAGSPELEELLGNFDKAWNGLKPVPGEKGSKKSTPSTTYSDGMDS